VKNSKEFERLVTKFPTKNNRIETVVSHGDATAADIAESALGTRIILDKKV